MATIPELHYYDPLVITPSPEPRQRCHCSFRFDRWEEFTEHVRDVTLAAAANAVDAPADRGFTGSSILDAFYNGKRGAVELIHDGALSYCPVCDTHHPVESITRGHVERGVVHNELGVSLAIERMGNDGRDVPEGAGEA